MSTRTKIGVIGIVLLAVGGYVRWFPPEGLSNPDVLEAACIRIGSVMAVLWIAYPELIKLPTWISAATMIATPVIAYRPKIALLILPLLFALWILSPKGKQRQNDKAK